jgi:hypothetical protein
VPFFMFLPVKFALFLTNYLIDELLEEGLFKGLPAVAPQLVAPGLPGRVQCHLVHCPLRRRSKHTKNNF